jgi:hypothetical protein
MGHTVTSQRMIVDVVLSDLEAFSRALRKDERILLQQILKQPLKHVGAISNASSIDVWAVILLAILLEQEKRIADLETKYERLAH